MSETIADAIMDIITDHQGEDNAIDARSLLSTLWSIYPPARDQIHNTRVLLDVIHDMRRNGCVIASSVHGYFKPRNVTEAYVYLDRIFNSRIFDMFATRRAQKNAIVNEYGRQLPMKL